MYELVKLVSLHHTTLLLMHFCEERQRRELCPRCEFISLSKKNQMNENIKQISAFTSSSDGERRLTKKTEHTQNHA